MDTYNPSEISLIRGNQRIKINALATEILRNHSLMTMAEAVEIARETLKREGRL